MRRWFIAAGLALALGVGFLAALGVVYVWSDDGLPIGACIGVVEVQGFIADPRPAVEALREFREDEDVKAVILRVDSPGGVIAPAQEIHEEVRRTASEKPLVVSMGTVAASGGYYISAPGTRILANPGTVTGSIGVIIQFREVHALFDKLGLRTRIVKSGPLKDAGSPFREMTEEERRVFQELVDDLFGQFVNAVAEGRGLPENQVRALADGRVYSGSQALELGLVDRLGGFWDAVEEATELAGIEGEPRLEYRRPEPRGLLRWVLGDDGGALTSLEDFGAAPLRYEIPYW